MITKTRHLLHILMKYARKGSILYLLCSIVETLIIVIQLWVIRYTVDAFFMFSKTQTSYINLLLAVVILFFIFVTQHILKNEQKRAVILIEESLTKDFGTVILASLLEKPYAEFEQEGIYDLLERTSQEPYKNYQDAWIYLVDVIGGIVKLAGIFAFFAQVFLWFLLANGIMIMLTMFMDYRIMVESDKLEMQKIPEERKMHYFNDLFFDKNAAMEISIF